MSTLTSLTAPRTRSAHTAAIAVLLAALAGCQVQSPDVLSEIARTTRVENAIVFHETPASIDAAATAEPTLSATQALRMALAHDPRLQSGLARVRVAEADANQARLLPNPILTIDLRFPHGSGSNTAFEATVAADLLSLLQKPGQIAAADNRLRGSVSEALTLALDVMSDVQQAYVAVQSVDAEIENAEARRKILEQLRDIARTRLNAGEGIRLDVLTLDAQITQATLDLADLQLTRMQDRLTLAKLIGEVRSAADWRLPPWEPPAGNAAPEADWIDAALQHRPEIHARQWETRALGDDLAAASFSPLAGGEAGVHTERDPDWRTGPSIALPLPIFDWGQAARAKLTAQRIAARHDLYKEQEDVIQEVRLAHATYLHSRQTLADTTNGLLPLQRQQLEQAQTAYRLGETDLTTLLLAETNVQLTLSKILELQENLTVARVKLQRAAGGAAVADALENAPAAPSTSPAPATTAPTSQPATGTAQ